MYSDAFFHACLAFMHKYCLGLSAWMQFDASSSEGLSITTESYYGAQSAKMIRIAIIHRLRTDTA